MISGPTISGISTTIISVSIGLVATSITSEPSSVSVERSVIEMPTPEIDCTSVVSAVSRDKHFARARDLEERRVHANDVRVHGVAHVRDDALAEPRHEIEPQRREHAEHDGRGEKQHEIPVDRGRVAHGQPFVDEVADRDRQRELRDRGDEQRRQRQRQHAPVRREERRQRAQRFQRFPLGRSGGMSAIGEA